MHVSNYFYNEENVRLADELCAKTGFDRAFFCNSGAEANEALLKLARRHFFTRRARRSATASSPSTTRSTAARWARSRSPARRSTARASARRSTGVTHVPYGDRRGGARGDGRRTSRPSSSSRCRARAACCRRRPGFLAGLRALADEHGALLLVDEVQTGIGRTGQLVRLRARRRRSPTRSRSRRGSAAASRSARCSCARSARRRAAPGHARLDVRRQPARLRGGAHGARVSRRRGSSRPPRSKGERLGQRPRRDSPRSCPTCATASAGAACCAGSSSRDGVDARAALGRARDAACCSRSRAAACSGSRRRSS